MCQVITYCYLQKPHVNQFCAPLHIVPPLWMLQLVPPDIRRGAKGARLGPAARLGSQPPGVRLTHRYVHGGIDDEILAKGSKFP